MHVFCIFVFAPVQHNRARKGTLEICSLLLLSLLLLLLLLLYQKLTDGGRRVKGKNCTSFSAAEKSK